ncbi:molybdopterin adenylyltransferase [Desulfolucanica intricata]|uniref:molybdopterin adenylyltransferase n=1 Tax=Desulfolucanica intricata TaxID=1285191 RepID=UPI000830F433|nr:molybdopterin adenylyltransferase [Desulfolucanica intricata]
MFKVGIVTVSDKGSKGDREDLSGQAIREVITTGLAAEVTHYAIIPDEIDQIKETLIEYADVIGVDLILTTGGTGFAPRDWTPEATREVVERLVPGIPEVMRAVSLTKTNRAMLSRAAAGIRGKTLIINLPGSPKAVRECLEAVVPALQHGLEILKGEAGECAR